jgi:hypothetical protein
MSTAVSGDQLEAYLKSLESEPSATQSKSNRINRIADSNVKSKFSSSYTTAYFVGSKLVSAFQLFFNEIFDGCLRDIAYMLALHSHLLAQLDVSISASLVSFPFQSFRDISSRGLIDILRRCLLIYVFISSTIAYLYPCEGEVLHVVARPIRFFLFWVSVSLILIPFGLGLSLARQIGQLLTVNRQTWSYTIATISWVKRVQLTTLGRELTHPMPPIAKIEEVARYVIL